MTAEGDPTARATPQNPRRLSTDFAGYLDATDCSQATLDQVDLIALDANALLDLYEIGSDARHEVMAVLRSVQDRLWVPHQAALEFSRNRKRTVIDRTARYKQVRDVLRNAPRTAAQELLKPIDRLLALRNKSRTTREWDPASHGLTVDQLRSYLAGVLEEAMAEFELLQAEQEISPEDVHAHDPLLEEIDALLAGCIGPGFRSEELCRHVDEAIKFRFPNSIPPGGADRSKRTDLLWAGDYLLWRQFLDRAAGLRTTAPTSIMLVTSEKKDDWWVADNNVKHQGRARPELIQELYEEAGAHLILLSLADFMERARTQPGTPVSSTTVEQLREAAEEPEDEAVDKPSVRSVLGLLYHHEVIKAIKRVVKAKFGKEATVYPELNFSDLRFPVDVAISLDGSGETLVLAEIKFVQPEAGFLGHKSIQQATMIRQVTQKPVIVVGNIDLHATALYNLSRANTMPTDPPILFTRWQSDADDERLIDTISRAAAWVSPLF